MRIHRAFLKIIKIRKKNEKRKKVKYIYAKMLTTFIQYFSYHIFVTYLQTRVTLGNRSYFLSLRHNSTLHFNNFSKFSRFPKTKSCYFSLDFLQQFIPNFFIFSMGNFSLLSLQLLSIQDITTNEPERLGIQMHAGCVHVCVI